MPGAEHPARTHSRTTRSSTSAFAVLMLALGLLPTASFAQHGPGASHGAAPGGGQPAGTPYPIRVVDRPTSLPHGTSRLDVLGLVQRVPGRPLSVTFVFGGGVGITDHLEIGGQIIPIQAGPALQFQRPELYASYSIDLNDSVSIIPSASIVYPLHDADPFFLDLTGELNVTFGHWGAFDAAPTVSLNWRGEPIGTALSVPMVFLVQLSERADLALGSGLGVARFNPRFGVSQRSTIPSLRNLVLPAMLQFTYVVPEKTRTQPLVDLTLQFSWPELWAHTSRNVGLQWTDWTVQVFTSWYVFQ